MTLINQPVQMPAPCACSSRVAIICPGNATRHLSLKCRSCGQHRGGLSESTAAWLARVANELGIEIITLRNGVIEK